MVVHMESDEKKKKNVGVGAPACNYSWTSHWLIRLSSMWDPKQVTILNIVFVLKKQYLVVNKYTLM